MLSIILEATKRASKKAVKNTKSNKKAKRQVRPRATPVLIDPDVYITPLGINNFLEARRFHEAFGPELFDEVVGAVVKSTINETVTPNMSIDKTQLSMAYTMAALAAAAALVSTKVLSDPKFAQNNKNLASRFSDALNRAVNIIAGDTSIMSRLRYNVSSGAFNVKENTERILKKSAVPREYIERALMI